MSKHRRPRGFPVFDTNIYSRQREKSKLKIFENSLFPLVVYYELAATKINRRRRQILDQFRLLHEKNMTLLVPTKEDWIVAASVVWQLHRRRRTDLPDGARLAAKKHGTKLLYRHRKRFALSIDCRLPERTGKEKREKVENSFRR